MRVLFACAAGKRQQFEASSNAKQNNYVWKVSLHLVSSIKMTLLDEIIETNAEVAETFIGKHSFLRFFSSKVI